MEKKITKEVYQEAYEWFLKNYTDGVGEEVQAEAIKFAIGASWQSRRERELFIDNGCLFTVAGTLYEYSGVVHDTKNVYGKFFPSNSSEEFKFSFSEVETIYWPSLPSPH